MSTSGLRSASSALKYLSKASCRTYSSSTAPRISPIVPRHLLSISDLTPLEFTTLVRNAHSHKQAIKAGSIPQCLLGSLSGKTIAMMFSKRSTRTRVSTEAAVSLLGGHPMFLGKADIQLGVNESLQDTSRVVSSMTSCMIARVGPHSDVVDLAKYSTVPVINALSSDYHPLQSIADFLTIYESYISLPSSQHSSPELGLGLEGLKVAWVGDSTNVLFDLVIGAMKLGVNISVASPRGYKIPASVLEVIKASSKGLVSPGELTETKTPEEAVQNADIIATDSWISMGQEAETLRRLTAFEGYQVTSELAQRGGAKDDWKFMHCLPRHSEEVSDDVFYSPRSLVFEEAENRLWAALSVLEAFVVNKGKII